MAEHNGTDVEAQAKEMGWTPKEEFKGDPDKWIDADAYVTRAETFIPYLRANNAKLKGERDEDRRKIQALENANRELQESVGALKEFNEETARQTHERARQRLLNQKKEALDNNQHEEVVEIDEALAKLETRKPPDKKKAEEKKPEQFDPMAFPWFREWVKENPWYGQDRKMTAFANAVGEDARANGTPGGPETFAIMAEETNKAFDKINGRTSQRKGSKVEGSRGGVRDDDDLSHGKTYADLPKEAKEACDRFAKSLVGPNKAYKTEKEWRERYVSQYDWS